VAGIKLDIVSAEHAVYSDEVDAILAPGVDGQLGILPNHAPLMTMLQSGELVIRKEGEESILAVTGGFLEVRPDRVIILADAAERADEIDIERAESAKQRAQERLDKRISDVDVARAEAALQRALIRLEVAEKRRRRKTRTQ